MPKKQEVLHKIADRVREVTGDQFICPLCKNPEWEIGDVPAMILGTKRPGEAEIGGSNYPVIPIICKKCGNTHLLNLLILGFNDLEELNIEPDD